MQKINLQGDIPPICNTDDATFGMSTSKLVLYPVG